MRSRRQYQSKPSASSGGWSHAGGLASRAIRRHKVAPQVTAAAVCDAAQRLNNDQFTPVSWKDGTLKLACHNYENLITTRQREETLLRDINRLVGSEAVHHIMYSIT